MLLLPRSYTFQQRVVDAYLFELVAVVAGLTVEDQLASGK